MVGVFLCKFIPQLLIKIKIMFLAINKHNILEAHSFEWTQDDELIICGKPVNINDWEIIWVEQTLPYPS
jgi:hypothetical protein